MWIANPYYLIVRHALRNMSNSTLLKALKRWKPTVVYGKPLEQRFKINYRVRLED